MELDSKLPGFRLLRVSSPNALRSRKTRWVRFAAGWLSWRHTAAEAVRQQHVRRQRVRPHCGRGHRGHSSSKAAAHLRRQRVRPHCGRGHRGHSSSCDGEAAGAVETKDAAEFMHPQMCTCLVRPLTLQIYEAGVLIKAIAEQQKRNDHSARQWRQAFVAEASLWLPQCTFP